MGSFLSRFPWTALSLCPPSPQEADALDNNVSLGQLSRGAGGAASPTTPQMLDYNVPLGKLNRGMAVLDVVRALAGERGVPEGQGFRANVLGWCIELLQVRGWVGGWGDA